VAVVKIDDLPEIIEIIDDDVDPFGERSPNTTIHDTGGPRWIGPVAAGALVALIGYGVATSASSSSAPRVEPATSTTISTTTTTQPAPTTTVAVPIVPYYAAEPSREYSVAFADTQDPNGSFVPLGNYQLWASPDATATSGSWFSIETYSTGGGQSYSPDAYRTQVGLLSITVAHTASGPTIVQFSPDGSSAATITSLGRSDEDLIRLAQSLTIERDTVVFNDQSMLSGYEQISSVPPWYAVQGQPVHQIYYTAGNDFTSTISLVVAAHPSEGQVLGNDIDRQIALRFFLDHATPFNVDGHAAVAGAVLGQRDYAMATWVAGDHIVTIAATMPVPQLIAIARTVHEVSPQEWAGMQLQATRHEGDNNFGTYEQTEPVAISFGTDAEGDPWTITVSTATFSDDLELTWQWARSGFGSTAGDQAAINTLVDGPRTYVLADLPRAVAATAQLEISRVGLDTVIVPFIDAGAELDRTFAAYAFSEATPYTAQIVGGDGTVLATWPSS
jgi:hypothetical protein